MEQDVEQKKEQLLEYLKKAVTTSLKANEQNKLRILCGNKADCKLIKAFAFWDNAMIIDVTDYNSSDNPDSGKLNIPFEICIFEKFFYNDENGLYCLVFSLQKLPGETGEDTTYFIMDNIKNDLDNPVLQQL